MGKPTVDLSEVAAFQRYRGSRCTVPGAIAPLTPAKRKLFVAALDSDLSASAISGWLKSLDVELSAWTLQRHRRKECRCDQS